MQHDAVAKLQSKLFLPTDKPTAFAGRCLSRISDVIIFVYALAASSDTPPNYASYTQDAHYANDGAGRLVT